MPAKLFAQHIDVAPVKLSGQSPVSVVPAGPVLLSAALLPLAPVALGPVAGTSYFVFGAAALEIAAHSPDSKVVWRLSQNNEW